MFFTFAEASVAASTVMASKNRGIDIEILTASATSMFGVVLKENTLEAL
ncbi:hypothetical protein SDC9_188300 [bioreactor metagenome]|uniref:Uncharacterized protein n=1 Tax=bioreactor metagenome TaxID=1076179 RepID=A0A645HNZ0_9ZZZZ